MSEKMMKIMKRSLALALALILVIGAGSWMKDARLKADEEAPEAEVVVEEAVPVEEPAPTEEPVIAVQQVEFTAEPVSEEPAAEPTVEPVPEPTEEPVAEEPEEEKALFDVREAYEHYMSLGSEAEKQAYLESLDAADRAELEKYIAEQEPVAVEAVEAVEEVEAVGRSAEAVEEAEPVEQGTAAGRSAEEEAEAEAEAELTEEPEEEPEKEPEEEAVPGTFGSAMISGEWAGRDTSSVRALSVEVYVDDELADSCYSEANRSIAEFSVALGDCTVDSESSTCGAFSGGNGSYKVDMYADTNATVTVKLLSPVVEEEPAAEEEAEKADSALEEISEEDESMATIVVETPVREKANGMSDVLTKLPANSKVKILDIDGDWLRVETEDGKEGFIFRADTSKKAEPSEESDKKVTIFTDRMTNVSPGDVITLSSRLEGFEDCESVLFQWECRNGKGWEKVPGATEDTYSFTFSDEMNHTSWRLRVITE